MADKVLIVIPARLGSTRIPEKILIDLGGKTMIQRVYLACKQSKLADDIVVATDDQKVIDNVAEVGGKGVLTASDHQCGTDRVSEVAAKFTKFDVFIDVHGDLPLLDPRVIDDLIAAIKDKPIDAVTPYTPISSMDQVESPAIVKVVMNQDNFALYFSRNPIPYNRDKLNNVVYYRHIGVFAYRRQVLATFKTLPSSLEHIEKIEPLRLLENNIPLKMIETTYNEPSVNTLEELEVVKGIFAKTDQVV